MKTGFAFRPPLVALPDGVAEVLEMAFGPVESHPSGRSGVVNSEAVVEAARTMALGGRIAARWPSEFLVDVLGPEATEGLRLDRRRNAVAEIRSEAVVENIAQVAAALKMPVIFLKGAAMVRQDLILPGSRGLLDVDVLAPDGRERELQESLKAEGCIEPQDLPCGEHQLQAMAHPLGLAVEVHLCIRGVRNNIRHSMTFVDLEDLGLTRRIDCLPGDARVPTDQFLLAHAVVHGLAQHGFSPGAYPMLRFVADLIDLGLIRSVESDGYAAWMPWIGRDVSTRELAALADMCCHLSEAGGAAALWSKKKDAALMLRHLVLGAVDADYRDSLRVRSLVSVLPGRGRVATLWRTLWKSVFLSRGQVEALYGTPSNSWGYWVYRLYRPFDLVGKMIRYGGAALKGRLR